MVYLRAIENGAQGEGIVAVSNAALKALANRVWQWLDHGKQQCTSRAIQPFSQKSRTATVPRVFQIGLCGVVEADLELICNSWSAGFLRERL